MKMKRMLTFVGLLVISLFTSVAAQADNTSKYEYSAHATQLRLDVSWMDYSDFHINGDHIVWSKMGQFVEQIYYGNLKTGQIQQITNYSSRKGKPIVTETATGTFIIWRDTLNFYGIGTPTGGADIFSYKLETKTTTQLNSESGPYFETPTAYKNHVAWATKGEDQKLYYYDLSKGTEQVVGTGRDPVIAGDTLLYNDSKNGLTYYRIRSGESEQMKEDSSLEQV